MDAFIDVATKVLIPLVTIVISYFGWKARAEKNKLKAEIEGMKASNTAKDIDNQSSWIDLYKKLHDDQAFRLSKAEEQILELNKTIYKFEKAFKQYHTCPHFASCPIQRELSKSKGNNKRDKRTNGADNRQREPPSDQDDESLDDSAGDG